MQTLKARGHRGNWFARIGDDDIPCAWLQWRTGNHYLNPYGTDALDGKRVKYIEALRRDQKVALTGKRENDGKWLRDGYIGLFEIANVAVTDRGLEFDFVRRIAHLR
jgi:hypothetical protein